jgi:two-component SAPR family response regulator
MKVLVVEDDIVIALTVSDALTEGGHVVIGPVSTASAALAWARADRPDFALVNIDLADDDKGTDLARKLREELGIGSFFISGDVVAAKSADDASFGYLLKPFSGTAIRESMAVAEALTAGTSLDALSPPDGLVVFNSGHQKAADRTANR